MEVTIKRHQILRGGSPTTLKAGDSIGFNFHDQTLVLVPEPPNGPRILWPTGDDKRIAHFIGGVSDFWDFAMILGEMHGLSVRRGWEYGQTTFISFV